MIRFNKRILAMLLTLLMIFSVTACSQQTTLETKGIFTPGTYTGEANGLNGTIKVEVKVDEDKILEVKILEHKESPGISDGAIKNIPEKIVKYQRSDEQTSEIQTHKHV